jgi:hypothetical protein
MMVLASVATISFVILLLFSLPSCLKLRATPFSAEGIGAGVSSPYLSDTSPDTNSRSGYCTPMRTFHIMRAPSFSPSSDILFVFPAFALLFHPNLLPPPVVTAWPTLVDAGTGRVGHAPGLSPCVSSMPSRRTWWRLPRLGYLSDEKSRSEIWSLGLRWGQLRLVTWQQSAYAMELVMVLCRFGGSRAGKTLAFSLPSQADAWCECSWFRAAPTGLFLRLRALSLYI